MPINNPPLFSNFCGCAPRVVDQAQIFGDNIAANRHLGSLAFLQFLKSRMNQGITSITEAINKPNGKKTSLVIQFDSPICPTFCQSPITCSQAYTSIKGGIGCVDLSIGDPYHLCEAGDPAAWSFDKADWAKYCDVDDDAKLQSQFAKVNKKLVEFVDGEMVKALQSAIPVSQTHKFPFYYSSTATGQPVLNPNLMFNISQLVMDGGYDGDYVIFGGSEARKLQNALGMASASQVGYDITKVTSTFPPIYYDRNFDTHFPNQLVVIPWKAVQLVTWNEFVGQGAQTVDNILKDGTTIYPLGNGSSIALDYRWKHDIECRKYLYDPRIYAELFIVPPGGCNGDAEFNGLLVIENCALADLPACP